MRVSLKVGRGVTQRKEHKIIQKVASQAQARTRPWDFRFGAMTGVGHVGRQGRLQPGGQATPRLVPSPSNLSNAQAVFGLGVSWL